MVVPPDSGALAQRAPAVTLSSRSMLILAACRGCAVDNHLTRKLPTNDMLLVPA